MRPFEDCWTISTYHPSFHMLANQGQKSNTGLSKRLAASSSPLWMIRVSTQGFTSLVWVMVQFQLAVSWHFSAKTGEHNFEIECCSQKSIWIICAVDYLPILAILVFRKRTKLVRSSHPSCLFDHSGCCHEIRWQLDPLTKPTLHGRSYAAFQKPDASS